MENLLNRLREHYPCRFQKMELLRDSGSLAYVVYSCGEKDYFLRVVKPSLCAEAIAGAELQAFLQKRDFPVAKIIFTADNRPYIEQDGELLILYEYIEGEDCDPQQDAEAIGALTARLHQEMRAYSGKLVTRDKHFYIDRYVNILRQKKNPRAEEYAAYGERLWDKLKNLPIGPCHGDLYCGNIRKAVDGKLYVHDFDTACIGFPMYDLTLICDQTEYFRYDEDNLAESDRLLRRFLPEYTRRVQLSQGEIDAFHALIAMQHFSTQATIVELFGPDCLDDAAIDSQLEWLTRWRDQCGNSW